MENSVAILSLVVAILAVFVSPITSWLITRRQIASSLAVSSKQLVAPMRQAWINDLRDPLAELSGGASHYSGAGLEDARDEECRRLTVLRHKIVLMLNPQEEDHQKLESLIGDMLTDLGRGADDEYESAHEAVLDLSRRIIKREWNRVKEPIGVAE